MKTGIIRSLTRACFNPRNQTSYLNPYQTFQDHNKFVLHSIYKHGFKWTSSVNNVLAKNVESKESSETQGKLEEEKDDRVLGDWMKISFITNAGERIEAEGREGHNVMEVAQDNGIEMEGACCGSLCCTTCHVYVEEKFEEDFTPPSVKEDDLLDTAPCLKPNSRLSCQCILRKEVEGATFTMPPFTVNMAVDGYKPKKH